MFGIPLLYPWANRLGGWDYEACGLRVELDRGSPLLHGTSTACRSTARSPPLGLAPGLARRLLAGRAELDFGAHPELLAVFPFPHGLELAIRLEGGR